MTHRTQRILLVAGLFISSVGALASTTLPAAGATPGPVAAYGFDEGSGSVALDASGVGHTGTVSGGAAWTSQGRLGGALTFDGVNDKVDIAHAADLGLTTGMTLEAWVRPQSLSGWRTVLLKERPSGLAYSLYGSDGTAKPTAYVHVGGADRQVTSGGVLPLNAWTHLASTYDGSTLRLFVDGVQVASRAQTGSLTASSGALRIGGNTVWGDEWFAGTIDEVRVYNRALTAAEIQGDMTTPVGSGTQPPAPPGADVLGRWSSPVDLGMVAVNMVYLHTGKILMFRGETMGGTSASVWNPATETMKLVPAPYNIFCSGHSQLADGRILVVGGHDSENGVLGSAKAAIFDPVAETWTSVPSMSQRRWYPSATTLPDGRVLVTSGAKTGFFDIADVPEIYDPDTNSWTRLDTARLSFPYYPFSFVLPDGDVLIAGAGEHPAVTRKLDVATQQWTTIDDRVLDAGSAAMYRPGKVIKTGTAATTDVSNVPSEATTYVLDMSQPSPLWRQTAPMAYRRAYHTLSPLPDGSVIVTGGGTTTEGKNVSAAVLEAEIWSPTTETWKTMAPMTVPRLYHGTALLMSDGRVMVAGSGDSYGGPNQNAAEFFEPPYLFKGNRPVLSSVPSSVPHDETFTAGVTGDIASVSLVRLGAVTHQFDEDTRYVPLTFTQSGNQLTVQAPANANLAPPGYYMLFAVSSQGVPSVARMLRLPEPGADSERPTAPTGITAVGGLGKVDLDWDTSTDNTGVSGYAVHRSTTVGFTPSATNRIGNTTTATSYADSGLAAGRYYYRVIASDAAGNESLPSAEVDALALADTSAPTVSVTAPAAGATISGSVGLGATADDNVGVTSVQFRVDGTDVGSPDVSAPYTFSWNSTSVPNGSHTIGAVARDGAGNQTGATPVTISVSNTTPPPSPALVGAWSFNAGSGTAANDSSSANNNGSVSGATWTASGKFGSALSFDGVNDLVSIPDAASLDLAGSMTLEAWLRPTTVAGWRTAVLKERPGNLAYALYASNGNKPNSHVTVGATEKAVSGPTALPLNAWSHLAVTYDGTALRLFVNGAQVSTTPVTGNMVTSTGVLRIGGNTVWSEWFRGLIDEVRVYSSARTATQIQSDMNTPIS